jgi:hypothetical protein
LLDRHTTAGSSSACWWTGATSTLATSMPLINVLHIALAHGLMPGLDWQMCFNGFNSHIPHLVWSGWNLYFLITVGTTSVGPCPNCVRGILV